MYMSPSSNRIYANHIIKGEFPDKYKLGGFHPVHLGDVLNERYLIFRKLGAGSQATIWLARDKIVPERRFVAIKIFGATESLAEIKLSDKFLEPPLPSHPGKRHIETALDSFMVHGPNGHHFCKVLEPLGASLYSILESASRRRGDLNAPDEWRGRVLDGDPWSGKLAKRACYQILLALDYLHTLRIAHRDIQPGNVILALEYDISSLSENEIQREVWPAEKEEIDHSVTTESSSSDSDTDSDDDDFRKFRERKKAIDEKWQSFERGNKFAEPHSSEWNKANFVNSREDIELLERTDGKPLQPYEAQYTVEATPLVYGSESHLSKSSRFVLSDLGFACTFEECENLPLHTPMDYWPPEHLLALPVTHKGEIFSLGLLFWETVMLRGLVESLFSRDDPAWTKNRQLRDLVQRLGPFPNSMRAQWTDANEFIDKEGNALDISEYDLEVYGATYGPDDFETGDIWHQGRHRKPLDWADRELELFISLLQKMLKFEAKLRPSTTELLQHEWFADIE